MHTPLYRLKTDPEKVTLVLMLLVDGCDLTGLMLCTPHAESTVPRWLERMGGHSPWAYAQTTAHLQLHVEWWRAYYHFVRPHESLGQKEGGPKRQRLRSPGMAAGLTGRLWTVEELLHLPLWPALA